MINSTSLNFGQRIDPENGLIESWFTHGALDEIKAMDLSDKIILMYGAGMGDVWLSKRCKELHIIERNPEWAIDCEAKKQPNMAYYFRPCNDSSGMDKYYLEIPNGLKPDIIISDDAYRTEAVEEAIKYFKQKEGGGILICDNWWQDYVWLSPKAIEMAEPFEKHIHAQTDHKDHSGNCWKTAIIFIK